MGILEDMSKGKMNKQEIWDTMPEYKMLGMTEEDVDMDIVNKDDEE